MAAHCGSRAGGPSVLGVRRGPVRINQPPPGDRLWHRTDSTDVTEPQYGSRSRNQPPQRVVRAARTVDRTGADETTAYAPDVVAQGGDHHVVGYGGHVHEPAQALVNGEFSFKGTLVGRYAELQELVALVDQGDVGLHTSRYDLDEINTVAERLEHGEIEGRAVITPP